MPTTTFNVSLVLDNSSLDASGSGRVRCLASLLC